MFTGHTMYTTPPNQSCCFSDVKTIQFANFGKVRTTHCGMGSHDDTQSHLLTNYTLTRQENRGSDPVSQGPKIVTALPSILTSYTFILHTKSTNAMPIKTQTVRQKHSPDSRHSVSSSDLNATGKVVLMSREWLTLYPLSPRLKSRPRAIYNGGVRQSNIFRSFSALHSFMRVETCIDL